MNAADDRAAELASLLTRMDEANEAAALRAKNQAAEILTEAGLNISALAAQIEERQLLMPPDIVAAIKRKDLPGEGDAAFIAPAAAVPASPAPISPTVHAPAYEPPKQLRPQPRRDDRITDRPHHGSFRRS